MSVDQPFKIYQEQLSSEYHGLALWDPNPLENLYKKPGHVSIGDVGYLDNGAFIRIFNVTLPWDDPSNKLLGEPGKYEPIKPRFCDIRYTEIHEGEYCSPHVSKVDNIGADGHKDSLSQMYQCRAHHRGALLSLPRKGHCKDVIRIKVFEKYIRENVDNWFRWSQEMMLPIKHMENLVLVTGCTLVSSWAAAAFDGHMSLDSGITTISLETSNSDGGGAQFIWQNVCGNVEYHNSRFEPNVQEPSPENQCIFIRGFCAKRTFFRTRPVRAEAEPLPADSWEDEIQVTRVPDGLKYRDPLSGVLDYIVERCCEDVSAAEDIIAIAHDDDLQFIKGVEILTADAVENFLRERKASLLIESGAAIIVRDQPESHQTGNTPAVSYEKEKIFNAAHSSQSTSRRSSTPSRGKKPLLRSPGFPMPVIRSIPARAPDFEKLAFVKYMKEIGREYRRQAMTSIYLCRLFIQGQEQTRQSSDELRSVLQVVDDALCSAVEARKKTSEDADAKFKDATEALSAYEKKKRHSMETVTNMMTDAKAEDKSSSTSLKRLKKRWRPLTEGPTTRVTFLLHRTLPDKNPIIVKQVLSKHSTSTSEVLWNFSRFRGNKRLTIEDNPHFYEKLPMLAEKNHGQFRTCPLESFEQEEISVVIDRPRPTGWFFLEIAKRKRAFSNVWVPKEAIIFKNVCGILEGEDFIVSAFKNTPNLWCFEEPPPSHVGPSERSDRNSPLPTTTATPVTSPTGALLEGWREPILRMCRSHAEIDIRISDKLPTGFSSGYSEPSLPSPLSDSSSIVGDL